MINFRLFLKVFAIQKEFICQLFWFGNQRLSYYFFLLPVIIPPNSLDPHPRLFTARKLAPNRVTWDVSWKRNFIYFYGFLLTYLMTCLFYVIRSDPYLIWPHPFFFSIFVKRVLLWFKRVQNLNESKENFLFPSQFCNFQYFALLMPEEKRL